MLLITLFWLLLGISLRPSLNPWLKSTTVKSHANQKLNEPVQKSRPNKLSDVSKSKWSLILRSYVDDPRNTDNSWMETSVYHLHLNDLNEDPDLKDSLLSALLSDAAPRMSKQSRSWMLEKDIADADALSWMSVDDNRLSDMFGNHSRMVLTVRAALMPDVKIIPLQNSRLIPLVSSSPEQDTLLEMLRAEKRLALLVSLATTDINAFHEA
jgi:hypothetical protein